MIMCLMSYLQVLLMLIQCFRKNQPKFLLKMAAFLVSCLSSTRQEIPELMRPVCRSEGPAYHPPIQRQRLRTQRVASATSGRHLCCLRIPSLHRVPHTGSPAQVCRPLLTRLIQEDRVRLLILRLRVCMMLCVALKFLLSCDHGRVCKQVFANQNNLKMAR
jgi:hypothetical protein